MTQAPPPNNDDLGDALKALEQEFQRPEPPNRPAPPLQRLVNQPVAPRGPVARGVQLVMVLLAINVIMYVATQILAGSSSETQALYFLGAKENGAIDQGEWWRLLTPIVLHGGVIHLLFNSWALYALGPSVESGYGTPRFLAIYLLSGLAGNMASYLFNADALSVGASGAIFGLLGALAARIFVARKVLGPEATKMQFGQIGSMIVINLIFGFTAPNIDNAAHIGGLIVGGLIGFVLAPQAIAAYAQWRPARAGDGVLPWVVVASITVALVGLFMVLRNVL